MPLTGPRQDSNQILPNIYDPTHNAIAVEIAGDSITLELSSTTDSIAIGNVAGTLMTVNSDGSINTKIEGLPTFQTSQYTVNTSAVQITPTPLANRSGISIKCVATSGNSVYIGNSSSVTASTGFPLFNNDVLNMDITSESVWAIGSAAGQTVAALEIGG